MNPHQLYKIIRKARVGQCRFRTPDRDVELELPTRQRLTPETLMALRGVSGVLDVREV